MRKGELPLMLVLAGAHCSPYSPADEAADAATAADSGVTPNEPDAGPDADGASIDAGGRSTPPSCQGLAPICGATRDRDCCGSVVVPGGSFSRSYDALTFSDPNFTAAVSTFALDTYEITVARFRAFVAAYPSIPTAGAGKNPKNATDPGWSTAWNSLLPATRAELIAAIKCDNFVGNVLWTDTPGGNEAKPINCMTWYEAFAFCTWDGARLPTEAEWNYASAGGSEQRAYPWSNPATSTAINATRAVYNPTPWSVVGSRPTGAGKWGHADLAGNIEEWVVDFYAPYTSTCQDCARLTGTGDRVLRGGGALTQAVDLLVSARAKFPATYRLIDVGARCARSP